MGGVSRGRWLVALLFAACGDDSEEAPADTGSIFEFDTRPPADTGRSDTVPDSTADVSEDGSGSGSGEQGSNDLPGGSPCTRSADCVGGLCIVNERFPSGYCTISDCDTVNTCGRGELCAAVGADHLCAAQCVANADCPENFRCEFVAGPTRAACLPLPPVVLKDDGEACTTSEERADGPRQHLSQLSWSHRGRLPARRGGLRVDHHRADPDGRLARGARRRVAHPPTKRGSS